MRLTTAATFKTYFQEGISTAYDDLTAGDAAVTITTSSGNIVIDAAANDTDIILKGSDGGADTTYLTIDGSDAGKATFNAGVVATTVVGSGAAQFATMGIGSAKDLGVGLHIKTADAGGGTPGAGRDNLIIEDSGSTGMTIIGGTNNDIGIAMGDSDDVNIGMINYNNANNIMTFQAGGNANILGLTASAVTINEDSDDVDFRVESNGNANMLFVNGGGDKVGIGADPDLGVLHIKTADSGGGINGAADELCLEGSGNVGMSILSGNDQAGRIYFGDDGDDDIGQIRYNHDDNSLNFKVNALADAMKIDSTGAITKPLQPCFLGLNGGNDTVNNAADTTIAVDTEIFDLGGDLSSNTFTAPVTGKYFVHGAISLDAGSGNNTRFQNVIMMLTCSNRKLKFGYNTIYTNEDDHMQINGSGVIDMDANDTFNLQVFASRHGASGATTTVGSSTDLRSGFGGYLLA
jgi:hypothetical protein